MQHDSHWNVIYIGGHSCSIRSEKITIPINSKSRLIFIEPVKHLIDKLIKLCQEIYPNNNFIFLNNAASDTIKTLTLFTPDINIFTEDSKLEYIEKGWEWWFDQLTSIHKDHIRYHNLNLPIKEIQVETITLNFLIEKYNIKSLDILCVDTEGHDFDILYALDFDKLKPKKIIFEHKHMEGTNKPIGEKYKQLLLKLFYNNYKVIKADSVDTWMELNKPQ